MSIRLLPKSEIAVAKASVRQKEIEEGSKLARSVDRIREVRAQEDEALQKFRRESIKKIHAEIQTYSIERDHLKTEVAKLKKERQEALKPLDRERAEIAKERERAAKECEAARIKSIEAQEAEKQAKKAVKQASDALARAATKDELAGSKLRRASNLEKEAEHTLDDAKKVRELAIQLELDVREELTHRDKEVAARELGCTMREANLKDGEAELAKGWALLEDRKATLERQIKRAKP